MTVTVAMAAAAMIAGSLSAIRTDAPDAPFAPAPPPASLAPWSTPHAPAVAADIAFTIPHSPATIPRSPTPQSPPTSSTPSTSGETLTIHLLTVGPGDRVEEIFGHNALLARDTATGYERAFNYGLFDPNAAGFLVSFFMGRMMYRVAPLPLEGSLASYRASNRRVWAQELDLDPADKARLFELLLTASLPENSRYRYQYFIDNCSTRLRDAIDVVLNGQLRAATDSIDGRGITWRYDTRRLTGGKLHYHAGIDLLLGPRGDGSVTRWQQMWVPMKLRDTLGSFEIVGADGEQRRLVSSEEVWMESDREVEPATSRSVELLFLFLGGTLGVLVVNAGQRAAGGSTFARRALIVLGLVWGVLCFVVGLVLAAMYLTDHEFMYWNRNILLFSPLGIGVAGGLVSAARRGSTGVWGRRFCIWALGLALLAVVLYLIPWGRQENLPMIALAMPVHLSLWWIMLRVYKPENALPYHERWKGPA